MEKCGETGYRMKPWRRPPKRPGQRKPYNKSSRRPMSAWTVRAPWDLRVRDPDFFNRLLAGGSLALGESFMDGWWSCQALDQLFDPHSQRPPWTARRLEMPL